MNYFHLNLGISSVLANKNILFKGTDPKQDKSWHWQLSVSDLDKDFLKLINQLGLSAESVYVFKTNPLHTAWEVHRDNARSASFSEESYRTYYNHLTDVRDFPKLNFIYGDNTSSMVWYANNNGIDQSIQIDNEENNASYHKYNTDDVHEIDRTVIKQSALVQSGVPHTVMNSSGKNRWCVSVIFSKDNRHIGMEDLAQLFKDYAA